MPQCGVLRRSHLSPIRDLPNSAATGRRGGKAPHLFTRVISRKLSGISHSITARLPHSETPLQDVPVPTQIRDQALQLVVFVAKLAQFRQLVQAKARILLLQE